MGRAVGMTVVSPGGSPEARGRKGWAVWLTGLPASGKTTIAKLLANRLQGKGVQAQVLESDELRKVITPKPTYSEEERDYFYAVMAYIGKLLTDNGVNVIFDATAPRRAYRERASKEIERFVEVYLECPLRVCMERDPKGIYRKAMEGLATTVPGLQFPYEEPKSPDLTLRTDELSPEECAKAILDLLEGRSWI